MKSKEEMIDELTLWVPGLFRIYQYFCEKCLNFKVEYMENQKELSLLLHAVGKLIQLSFVWLSVLMSLRLQVRSYRRRTLSYSYGTYKSRRYTKGF